MPEVWKDLGRKSITVLKIIGHDSHAYTVGNQIASNCFDCSLPYFSSVVNKNDFKDDRGGKLVAIYNRQ